MSKILSLLKHNRKESKSLLKEIKKTVSFCEKNIEKVSAFGSVIVEKDGTINTYYEVLDPKSRLALMGSIDVLKEVMFRSDFDFDVDQS